MKNWKFIFILLFLMGCNSEVTEEFAATINQRDVSGPPISDPTDPEFPTIKKIPYQKTQWKLGWSDTVVEVARDLGFHEVEVLPNDLLRANCPGYKDANEDQRLAFWLVFVAAMAQQESSMNERLRYFESGLNKYSEGLLQLSTTDAQYHRGCEFIDSETILQGDSNLSCGLAILKKQLDGVSSRGIVKGTLFPARYYYWSVLTKEVTINRISQFVSEHQYQIQFCKN